MRTAGFLECSSNWLRNGCQPMTGIPRLCLISARAVLTCMAEQCRESGTMYPLQVHGASVAHVRQANALSLRDQKLGHEAGPWPRSLKSIVASPPSIPLLDPHSKPLLLAPASFPVLELIKLQADCGLQVCEPVPARHHSERSGAQLPTSTPALLHPGLGASNSAYGVVPVPIKGWAGDFRVS